ncbi:glycoside hydrolase superfamily [Microdochium trichocladiopsis]|uniref:Glycoside hydrolase superfamily n=1 Tax=Microdochium trichocladiopsis TaxID=1682393 RepID=A0A9P8XZK2_9PEZI|nr:glycoside hydrolase superfamily [Microdochium trichocladiopsis]KAH7026610.1 glycoside hydrolase superfamily [Microdochium trichocladiopsis]
MRASAVTLAAGLFAASAVSAENYLGFNSGATLPDNSAKFEKDFEAEFRTAQNLVNAPGTFNAVRLYTNIQAYSEGAPIEAFQAAMKTNTKILLGVWASGVQNIDKELAALKTAVNTYGKKFTDLVIGISIGSEDLYRISQTGLINDPEGVGAGPDVIVKFIGDFKKAFANTALSSIPVGHVDTWDVWANGTNKPVIDAVDFLGFDTYPYYENGKGNSIDNAPNLFDRAYKATEAAAGGKPIWVTETGWPATGPNWDLAVPSVPNAKQYWDEIGCAKLFNKVPTFWYNLRDSNPANKMQFAITKNLSTTPLFDLTCPKVVPSSTSSAATPSQTSSGATSPSGSGSNSNTGSGSGSSSGTPTGGSNTGSGSATQGSGTPIPTGAAAGVGRISGAVYGALAVVAGGFALL